MNSKESEPVWPSRPTGEGQSLLCNQPGHEDVLQSTGKAKEDNQGNTKYLNRQEGHHASGSYASWDCFLAPAPQRERKAVIGALVREAMKSYSRVLRHVTRRGFGDIAEDAVQETLLLLVRRAMEPAFVPPVVMLAWLYFYSVCSAFVLRRHGRHIDYVTFDEEVEAYARQQIEFAEADAAASPDRGLLSEVEERALADWCERTKRARAELLPRDRETFDVEVARRERGEAASPLHRKRLERARPRARRVFARYHVTSASPPDDLLPPVAPTEP